MSKICLVVIFNHRYDANLPKLRKLYDGRFDSLIFLVPFYRGCEGDVLPVYEASYYFQGAVAQASSRLSAIDCDHYVFIADDVLLNPALNKLNITAELNIAEDAAYIKELRPLCTEPFEWINKNANVLMPRLWPEYLEYAFAGRQRNQPFSRFRSDVNFSEELPTLAVASDLFARHNLRLQRVGLRNLRGYGGGLHLVPGLLFNFLYLCIPRELPYPLAISYSDFFIVPKEILRAFAHLCGVFAAMNLFAEVAIPTALVLTCRRIATEAGTRWKGKEIWTKGWELALAPRRVISDVYRSMAPDQTYLHPVKLSRWDLDLEDPGSSIPHIQTDNTPDVRFRVGR